MNDTITQCVSQKREPSEIMEQSRATILFIVLNTVVLDHHDSTNTYDMNNTRNIYNHMTLYETVWPNQF